jgi:hypothetical protein
MLNSKSLIKSFLLVAIPALSLAQEQTTSRSSCVGRTFRHSSYFREVPKTIRYLPSDSRCRNNASISIQDRAVKTPYGRENYFNLYSIVLRDACGGDRIPDVECEQNSCSIVKEQSEETFTTKNGRRAKLFCFGAPGSILEGYRVDRFTLKLNNDSDLDKRQDGIRRYLLNGRSALTRTN